MNRPSNELILKSFQPSLTIDFGDVIFGRSEMQYLFLKNEFDDDQEIKILKAPSSGFFISSTEAIVKANSSIKLEISWTPVAIGNAYEKLTIKADRIKLEIKLIGSSIEPKNMSKKMIIQNKLKTKQKPKYLLEDKENIMPKPLQDMPMQSDGKFSAVIAQDQKNFECSSYSSSNDDLWLKTQEECFVKWLNRIFTSNETKTKLEDLDTNKMQYKLALQNLFHEPFVTELIKKIDTKVSEGAVVIKSEVLFRHNTVAHNQLIELILNYNHFWLLLGFETIFNLDLNVPFSSTNVDAMLRTNISTNMLWNTTLARKHNMKKNTKLLISCDFELDLHRHIMKKYFIMVFFLDIAKRSNILPDDINLFRSTSMIKSSSEMMTKFTSMFLKGEGAILKKLNKWGISLGFVQLPLNDYDFTVTNLSKDITDGVRLVKLAKILIGVDVMDQLRFPADDLSRKIFNINLAINEFKKAGTAIVTYSGREIDVTQIPLGHREKTLALLWCILSRHYIDAVIEREKLIQEIKRLGEAVSNEMTNRDILKFWIQVISKQYNIDVSNSTDFIDGRVMCLLVHHYLPEYLKLSEIHYSSVQADNDMKNFQLFFNKLKVFGGAPIMVSEHHIPNQDQITATLAYFSSRLIDLTKYHRAANCIQRAWRKYRMFHKCLAHYLKYQPEVIVTQSCVRRYLCLKQFKESKNKIVICQSIVRRFLALSHYNRISESVLTIQKYVRRFLVRREYVSFRYAAVCIQSNWRMAIARKHYNEARAAVITIQSFVRGALVRSNIAKQHKAATLIQKNFKCNLLRRKFVQLKQSSIIIQKNVRRYLAQRDYRNTISAVVAIQNSIRVFICRRKYIQILTAAIIIQKHVRSFQVRNRYNVIRSSVITIQKSIRMHQYRSKFTQLKSSTIVIQKNFRRFLQQRSFVRQKQAAITIQKTFRGYLARKQMVIAHQAAIKIQSRYRSFVLRKRYTLMKDSAIVIQKYVRTFICKSQYCRDINSILSVQSSVRMFLARKRYQKQLQAINTIQRFTRSFLQRKHYLEYRSTVITVQATVRRFICRKRYVSIVQSVLIIQTNIRRFLLQSRYQKQKSSAIAIQKNIRGYLARKQLARQHNAARVIQNFYHSYSQRAQFLALKNATVIIQKYLCGYLARKQYLEIRSKIIHIQSVARKFIAQRQFQLQRKASICIQKHFRRFVTRKSFCQTRDAALCIQKNWRASVCRRAFVKKRQSAVIIQKHYRRFIHQTIYQKQKRSVIVLQKHWRGYLARKHIVEQHRAARIIQNFYHSYSQRAQFLAMKNATITIQKNWRGYIARRKYADTRRKIILVQSIIRKFVSQKKYREKIIAIISVQKFVRGFLARTYFIELKKSTIVMQKNYRMKKARTQFNLQKRSCITIQSHVRSYICYARFQMMKKASNVIQKHWRGYCVRVSYERTVKAIVTIQKSIRRFITLKRFQMQKQSAITIQRYVRGFLSLKQWKRMKQSVVIIQKYTRAMIAKKKFEKMRSSSITIQRFVRGYLARMKYEKRLRSVVKLQPFIRGSIARLRYQRLKTAAMTIQKTFRCVVARKAFIMQRDSAIIIQKYVKRFIAKKQFTRLKAASIMVSKLWRGQVTRRFYMENKENMMLEKRKKQERREQACIMIQRTYQSYIQRKAFKHKLQAIVFIQLKWRFICHQRRQIAFVKAAITIQRIWRGRKVRNNLKQKRIGPEITQIRQRFIDATRRFSKFTTVRYIGVKALEDLMKDNCSVAQILKCLSSLEKVTSLSREICKWLVDSNAYDILVDLIHDCNRGEADLDIVSKSISVLFNLGKAGVLNLNLIGPEVGSFLKDLLIRNNNAKRGTKGVTVFCHTCLLLVLLMAMERKRASSIDISMEYSISTDPDLRSAVTELRRNLQVRVQHSPAINQIGSSDKIINQMRLNPSWDLARRNNSNKHLGADTMKRASTNSLQEMKSKSLNPTSDSVFKRPANLPIPPRSSRHICKAPSTKSMETIGTKSSSLTRNVYRTASVENDKRSPNIWDINHQLYALNLLCKSLDV